MNDVSPAPVIEPASRRPQYMVTVFYEEPSRGYELTLHCGCGIAPKVGRVVEVFVTADRDTGFQRLCDDMARLLSFHLQLGVFAPALAQRMNHGGGPGRARFPGRRYQTLNVVEGLSSPLGAIVEACRVAQEDWRLETEQLAREGVVRNA